MAGISYDQFRISPLDPSTLRHADVERLLRMLADAATDRLAVETFAESHEGRPIYLATLGDGPRRVLLWSQMHGDEPTHTAVLLDLLSVLTQHAAEPAAAEILRECTLFVLPMLNPDGAEAVTRANAQGIDVNRDALRLVTPEGRALRRAVDTLRAEFGFNLHNQSARAAVGQPSRPAVVSVMAPALDAAATETPHVRRAKQVAVCLVEAMRPRADGMVARYEAEFMPWSFGEAVQASGVVTVLVEAGGWPDADPTRLVELHFDGLVAALRAIATGTYRAVDPAKYDALPKPNATPLFDCVIAGGHVLDARTRVPFRADVAINHSHGHRLALSHPPDGTIVDFGDLGAAGAKRTIDATGCVIVPGRLDAFDKGHSALGRGSAADLVIFALDDHELAAPIDTFDMRRLRHAIVAGEPTPLTTQPAEATDAQ